MLRIVRLISFLLLTGCASGGETDSRPIAGAWSGDIQSLGAEGHSGFATVTLMSKITGVRTASPKSIIPVT